MLLAYRVDQLDDDRVGRADGLAGLDHWFGKPVALKQLHSERRGLLVLRRCLDLLDHDRRVGFFLGQPDHMFVQVGLEREQVDLDVRGQRQPFLVGEHQHGGEGQLEPLSARLGQRLHRAVDGGLVVAGHRRDLEHDAVWLDQFEVLAVQAFMGAVDKHRAFAHQCRRVGLGQDVEQQLRIAGGVMFAEAPGTVEQLVTEDLALVIDDGLAGDRDGVGLGYVRLEASDRKVGLIGHLPVPAKVVVCVVMAVCHVGGLLGAGQNALCRRQYTMRHFLLRNPTRSAPIVLLATTVRSGRCARR